MNTSRPTRLVLSAGVLAVSLTACGSGAGDTTEPVASTRTATRTATPAAPPAAAPASGSAPAGIPAGALLQPADVGGAQSEALPEGEFAHLRPLRPCGTDPYPSDGSRTGAVAVRFTVERGEEGSTPTVVTQFVGRHEPGGAAEQFADVREALSICPGKLGEGERRWTTLGSGGAGDESVLVRIDTSESYADEEASTVSRYAGIARVGDAIVVVADEGWENLGGSEDLVKELLGKAAERAGSI